MRALVCLMSYDNPKTKDEYNSSKINFLVIIVDCRASIKIASSSLTAIISRLPKLLRISIIFTFHSKTSQLLRVDSENQIKC